MHVLGLPPAFVLSQDQTLKLKVSILVLAWRLSKESLRNGHLHTKRILPGLPRTRCAMVMAETQRSPESVRSAKRLRASMDPPGLRRLRFSFFNPLVKERSGRSGHNAPARHSAAPSRGKREPSPGRPREASCQSGDCLPTAAHQYMAREAPVINLNHDPCQRLDEEFLSAVHRSAHAPCLPQNGPHCNAHTRGACDDRWRAAAPTGWSHRLCRARARRERSCSCRSRVPVERGACRAGGNGGTARGMNTKRHAPLGRRRVHLGH